MSGPMPREVAEAAHAAVLLAEAGARGVSPGIVIRERLQAREGAESLADATWRGYSHPARMLLVKYAAKDCAERPGDAARNPWHTFSKDDRLTMGAMARELGRTFKTAVYLV